MLFGTLLVGTSCREFDTSIWHVIGSEYLITLNGLISDRFKSSENLSVFIRIMKVLTILLSETSRSFCFSSILRSD